MLLALAACCLLGPPAAGADRGAALDVGRIEITQALSPGKSYALPTFGVRNPGTERTRYRLGLSYFEGQRAMRPPGDWFRFPRGAFKLRPGDRRLVAVRLAIPKSARAGDYEALVGAQIVSDSDGAQVGAGAASRVTFTVASPGKASAWLARFAQLVEDWSPWSYAAPGLALLGLALWRLGRRVRIQVSWRA